MPRDYQPSFTGGELAEGLHARTDLQRYQSALAQARNVFMHAQGGVSSRGGFEFIYAHPDNKPCRLIPFEFNTEQTYILVFSDLEMRVIKDGGVVLEAGATITAAPSNNAFTAPGHAFSTGDEVYFTGTGTEADNRFMRIVGVSGTTFSIPASTAGWTGGGSVARVYVKQTPYVEADLFQLSYTQSADVMTLCHENYIPRKLSRLDHDNWTLTTITFKSRLDPPADLFVEPIGWDDRETNRDYRYVVTAVNSEGDESVASAPVLGRPSRAMSDSCGLMLSWTPVDDAEYYNVYKEMALNSGVFGFIGESEPTLPNDGIVISAISAASPTVVTTATDHNLNSGDSVTFYGITGDAAYRDLMYQSRQIFKITDTSFSVMGYSTLGAPAYTGAGKITDAPGFIDYNLGADNSITPPIAYNPFNTNQKYPRSVAYHQQRIGFGGSKKLPQTLWLTKSADYDNMDYSRPRRADDSIELTLAHVTVNEIRHIVSKEDLIVMTSGGVWLITGDESGVLKANGAAWPRRQESYGCSWVKPIEVGAAVLFVQDKGTKVRDLAFSLAQDKQTSSNLSIMANHMFDGYEVVDWCYTEEPNYLVSCVRNDGDLLVMTFVRDQDISGWARHFTDGEFKSVAGISEGEEDIMYAVINREIDGASRYFIERRAPRNEQPIEDSFCVDAGLTWRGRTVPISNFVLAPNGAVQAPGHGFTAGDVIRIVDAGGVDDGAVSMVNRLHFQVASVSGSTIFLNDMSGNAMDLSGATPYLGGGYVQASTNRLTGLHHLGSKDLVALADGNVVTELKAVGGVVNLANYASVIHIGLPYRSYIRTLPVDLDGTGSATPRKKTITGVKARVINTRGLSVGASLDKLYDVKERESTMDYGPITQTSGIQEIYLGTPWSDDGSIYIVQDNPLPMKITSINPEVSAQ